jgi:S1-C subfamily serine protease
MPLMELFEQVRSGVFHINFVAQGRRVASGSGFLVSGLLVTNNHVFRGPPNAEVFIRHADSDPQRFEDAVRMPSAEFARRLRSGSDEQNFDFAVLDMPELVRDGTHQFTFAPENTAKVGKSVAFLGYPLEHQNLVCHAGLISSIYQTGPVKVLQLDASVNASNSGGPLLDVGTGQVIGIVTRKATGLTQMFQQLLQSFEQNIQALQGAQGMVGLGGVDPILALMASQRQMQTVAREIERSANVGIGYAFSSEHVAADAVFRRS